MQLEVAASHAYRHITTPLILWHLDIIKPGVSFQIIFIWLFSLDLFHSLSSLCLVLSAYQSRLGLAARLDCSLL